MRESKHFDEAPKRAREARALPGTSTDYRALTESKTKAE
jgi:hypothetical protein